MDIAKEYQEQFATAWPEALRKVKQLAEQKSASKQASSSA
jgi:hypothetical protein